MQVYSKELICRSSTKCLQTPPTLPISLFTWSSCLLDHWSNCSRNITSYNLIFHPENLQGSCSQTKLLPSHVTQHVTALMSQKRHLQKPATIKCPMQANGSCMALYHWGLSNGCSWNTPEHIILPLDCFSRLRDRPSTKGMCREAKQEETSLQVSFLPPTLRLSIHNTCLFQAFVPV